MDAVFKKVSLVRSANVSTNSRRWVIWGVLCLAYIIVYFQRLSLGAVKDTLIDAFKMSEVTFANLGSAYFYAYIVMQLPTGILADTIGPRLTVSLGLLLASVGSVIFGFAGNIYIAFAGRLLVGLGVSVVFVSFLKILSVWFAEEEFGKMNGITVFMGNMGGIFAQTPLIALVSLLTWRYAFAAVGLITLLIAILCFLTVKDKPERKIPVLDKADILKEEKVNVRGAVVRVIRNGQTWPVFIAFACLYGAYFSFTGIWGQNYLVNVYGFSRVTAGNYMMLPILSYSFSVVLLGYISEKLSKRKLPVIVLGAVCILSWALIVFWNQCKPPVEFLGVLLCVLGSSSSIISMMCSWGKELNDPNFVGISTSFINTGGFVGTIVIPLLMGWTMDKYSGMFGIQKLYSMSLIICFFFMLAGYLFLFSIRETNCKNIRI